MHYLRRLFGSRHGVLGINARNLEYIYPLNYRGFFPNVDDKLTCKYLLRPEGIPIPETYHIVRGPASLASWPEQLTHRTDFVIKPNRSYGGHGILLVTRDQDRFLSGDTHLNRGDIDYHVRQILSGAFTRDNMTDVAFFEQKLNCHPVLEDLSAAEAGGVPDVRIIFKGEQPIMAMLRLPTKESQGRANLHQGGIGVGIDLTGGITLNGCYGNRVITRHPDSGRLLRNTVVPAFRQMLELGSRISRIVRLGYIGVDFIVDPDCGPVVIEVNARPGLNIQIANQAGLRARLS